MDELNSMNTSIETLIAKQRHFLKKKQKKKKNILYASQKEMTKVRGGKVWFDDVKNPSFVS